MTTAQTPQFDLDLVFDGIDQLAAQRPVCARIVAAADADDTDAKTLAGILAGEVALTGRVMKLANSAYYGMRGRVASLQQAVTVVGFTTVRTMATVALTDLDDESRLPEEFWTVGTGLAAAAARLAPLFDMRPADALCLGVLAQLGSALLYHHDRDNYTLVLAANPTFAGRRRAEADQYGMSSAVLTAAALTRWEFPQSIVVPLERLDDRGSTAGGLLRACYEIVSRLTMDGHRPAPIGPLTRGRIRDEELAPMIYDVRNEAEGLRRLMLGD
ncbi:MULTISPECIES: HDOD domain-containing protein [unclassified Blastococcus]|uniref:HDOD domain-containing protein n=1 Tax=unclassified Blastococcus TaxID=2619396 RepID=UPI00281530CC|nr:MULTISPECIES: HDOD domain-containing protein [unclassified Blastococcus]